MTAEEIQQWEIWLTTLPENVRVIAKKIVTWKEYKLKDVAIDIGNRYIPTSYEDHTDGSITITCKKVNTKLPYLGGYYVFGISPDGLIL